MATKSVKAACEDHWDKWKSDCSHFLKAVAADFGITLTGQANDIIVTMGKTPWLQFGNDAVKAVAKASSSYLVVAGLQAKPNGHVVVIMPGTAHPYPTGYWGHLGGVGRKNTTINWAWTHADLKKVQYFAKQI